MEDKTEILEKLKSEIRQKVSESKYVDVALGAETQFGTSISLFRTAVHSLRDNEGYKVHYLRLDQKNTPEVTTAVIKILAAPGTEYRVVWQDREEIRAAHRSAQEETQ